MANFYYMIFIFIAPVTDISKNVRKQVYFSIIAMLHCVYVSVMYKLRSPS